MEWTPQSKGARGRHGIKGFGRGAHRRHAAFGHCFGTGQIAGGAITTSSNSDKYGEMNTVLRSTKSSRLQTYSDRVKAVNNAGKLLGTASLGVIGSGELSRPTDFERRPGGAW
jgi:hypothetical protein